LGASVEYPAGSNLSFYPEDDADDLPKASPAYSRNGVLLRACWSSKANDIGVIYPQGMAPFFLGFALRGVRYMHQPKKVNWKPAHTIGLSSCTAVKLMV
jgi:hypothetical protein